MISNATVKLVAACLAGTCTEPTCPPLLCAHPSSFSPWDNSDAYWEVYGALEDVLNPDRRGVFSDNDHHTRCCNRDKEAERDLEEQCYFPSTGLCQEGEFPVLCLPYTREYRGLCDKKPYTCRGYPGTREVEKESGESHLVEDIVNCTLSESSETS